MEQDMELSAGQRVAGTLELVEQILIHAAFDPEASSESEVPKLRWLLNARRVNTLFRSAIVDLPTLQRILYLRPELPYAKPRHNRLFTTHLIKNLATSGHVQQRFTPLQIYYPVPKSGDATTISWRYTGLEAQPKWRRSMRFDLRPKGPAPTGLLTGMYLDQPPLTVELAVEIPWLGYSGIARRVRGGTFAEVWEELHKDL